MKHACLKVVFFDSVVFLESLIINPTGNGGTAPSNTRNRGWSIWGPNAPGRGYFFFVFRDQPKKLRKNWRQQCSCGRGADFLATLLPIGSFVQGQIYITRGPSHVSCLAKCATKVIKKTVDYFWNNQWRLKGDSPRSSKINRNFQNKALLCLLCYFAGLHVPKKRFSLAVPFERFFFCCLQQKKVLLTN